MAHLDGGFRGIRSDTTHFHRFTDARSAGNPASHTMEFAFLRHLRRWIGVFVLPKHSRRSREGKVGYSLCTMTLYGP